MPTLRVRALIIKDNHILMARLISRPVMFLPGGRVESGENLESALIREIYEETKAAADNLSYLGCIEHVWRDHTTVIHDLSHFFTADVPELSVNTIPVCDDEGVELFWLPIEQLMEVPIEPRIAKSLIQEYIKGDRLPWWDFIDETTQTAQKHICSFFLDKYNRCVTILRPEEINNEQQ